MKNLLDVFPRWAWVVGLLCLGTAAPAWAQLPSTAVVDPDLTQPRNDTARVAPKLTKAQKRERAAADSVFKTERLFGLRVTRAQKAGYLALLPGAGQIYNRRWWKLPLVYGLVGSLGSIEYFYWSRYSNYVKAKELLQTDKTYTYGDERLGYARLARNGNEIESGIIFYRRNRDLYILVFMAGYGLQILDAVVDAHLHDFDVGRDLSLHWQPALLPVPGQVLPGIGATVALRVK
ncbi:MAG TPA: DUF5683 domain-containing protein [Hymenobacter sp.]|uniref:DUF5683 domain-containing protein n=1 Tax=Hymenobacter sp. TaxID=1898978 RepID=UPI002D7E77BA|nr:DUF5683 domain-containing protein [Hymenobacter sp.]HET9506252.1 DUF5683 domain-containing protein [Hymenobacter sp.]